MTAPYLRVVVPCGAVQKQPDPTRSRAKLCHRDTAPVAANRVAVRAENNGVHCCMNDSSEARSEERRVGKECVSTCRSRWSPSHYKKKRIDTTIERRYLQINVYTYIGVNQT